MSLTPVSGLACDGSSFLSTPFAIAGATASMIGFSSLPPQQRRRLCRGRATIGCWRTVLWRTLAVSSGTPVSPADPMEHWDSNFAANCAKNETATSIDGTSSSSSSSINSRSRAVDVTGTIPVGGLGVTVGQFAETRRRFSVRDVEQFGRLVGDDNPLHRRQRLSWTGNGKQNETNDTKNSGLLASTEDHPLLLVKQEVETTIDQNNNERVHFYYTRPIVHGMLVASLFTSILGTLIPGAVYLSQDLEFLKPVYATNVDDDDDDNLDDDDIDSCSSIAVGRIDVIRIRPFRRRRKGLVLVCDTTVTYQGEEAVRGTAKVWIPNGIEKDELS